MQQEMLLWFLKVDDSLYALLLNINVVYICVYSSIGYKMFVWRAECMIIHLISSSFF